MSDDPCSAEQSLALNEQIVEHNNDSKSPQESSLDWARRNAAEYGPLAVLGAVAMTNLLIYTDRISLDTVEDRIADLGAKGKLGGWSDVALEGLQTGSKAALITIPAVAIAYPTASRLKSNRDGTLYEKLRGAYDDTKASFMLANRGLLNNEAISSKSRLKRFMAGTFLASALSILTANGVMIGEAIQKGPNDPLEQIDKEIGSVIPDNYEISIINQIGTRHLMNDSSLLATDVQRFLSASSNEGSILAVPYTSQLTGFNSDEDYKTGYVFGDFGIEGAPGPIMPEVKEGANCTIVEEKCQLEPGKNQIVVDEHEGMEIGDEIEILGNRFNVVGFSKDEQALSILGRLSGVTDIESAQNLQPGQEKEFSGILTAAQNLEDVKKLLFEVGLSSYAESTEFEDFMKNNENFWRDNGTALVLLLVSQTGVLASIAWYNSKRTEQEFAKSTIGMLRATGASAGQLAMNDLLSQVLKVGKATLIAPIITPAVSAFVNGGITGFNSRPNLSSLATGVGLTLAAGAAGTAVGVRSLKKIQPSEALKG